MKLFPVLSIVAVHVVVQARVLSTSLCPARDGKRYIQYALRLEEEPWAQALRTSDDHAGFPIVLHLAFQAGKAVGIEFPAARIRIAEGVTSFAGLLFALCAFFAARGLFGDIAAWSGVVCLVMLPRPADLFGDVLSDPLHALLWMASAALVLRGIEGRRAGVLALAGAVGSLAYWVRVDAVTLPAAVAMAFAALAVREKSPWREARAAGCYFATFAAGIALFVFACGRLSPKPVSGHFFIGLHAECASSFAMLAVAALPASAAAPLISLYHAVKDLGQEVQFVHLATAGLAAAFALRVRKRGEPGAAGIFVVASIAAYAAVTVAVDWRYGYVSGRYFLPVLPFILCFGVKGTADAARRTWPANARAPALAAGLVILASAACSIPSFVKSGPHEQTHGQLAAGRWIAEHIVEGDTLHDPYFYPSYLAGLRARNRPASFAPEAGHTHFAIAEDGDLPAMAEVRKLIEENHATRAAEFPRREGGREKDVAVYRIDK